MSKDKEITQEEINNDYCIRCRYVNKDVYFPADVVGCPENRAVCIDCFRNESPDHEALKSYDENLNVPRPYYTSLEKEMDETHAKIFKTIIKCLIEENYITDNPFSITIEHMNRICTNQYKPSDFLGRLEKELVFLKKKKKNMVENEIKNKKYIAIKIEGIDWKWFETKKVIRENDHFQGNGCGSDGVLYRVDINESTIVDEKYADEMPKGIIDKQLLNHKDWRKGFKSRVNN